MSQIDDFLDGQAAQPQPKSQIDSFLDAAPPPSRGFKGWVGDALGVATRGAIAVPEAVVGALDIPTRGAVGKFLENEDGMVGFRPKQGKEAASELFDSDATKAQNSQFQEADGVVGKAKVALSNPSMIGRAVGESIPSMLTGGVAARGVQAATKIGPAIAGAIGEGIVGAGSQAEQIRQETPDGLLTPTQSALAGATGLATTAFGAAGGRVAQRLGIGDAETLLAQGAKGVASKNADDAARAATNPLLAQAPKSVPRSVIEGAISEGLLEELPQSLAEQLFQNLALDKPWDTDLDGAAVMGVLSGGAMGAGAAGYSAATRPRGAAAPGQEAAAAGAEAAAGVPADSGLELAPMGGDLPAQGPDVRDTPLAEQSAMDSVRTTFDPRAGTQPAPGLLAQADPNGIPFETEQPAPAQIDTGNLALDDGAAPPALGYNPLAGTPTVFPDGSVALNGDQEFEARTGVNPRTMRPSQAMGLDPAAGSMSAAAALAVDSGATQQLAATEAAAQAAQQQQTAASQAQQAQAKEQAAAEKATAVREQAAEKAARAGQARLDMVTGDLLEPASISNLTGQQLDETYRAARKPETRRILEKELAKRSRKTEAPAEAAAPAPADALAAAPAPAPAAEAKLSARERAGLASSIAGRELADQALSPELAGLQDQLAQVQQRARDNGSWNVPLMAQRRRIEDAIAKLQPATTTKGEASGPETDQAQQDRAQPPQGPAAPAVAPAAPDAQGSGGPQSAGPAGVADGGTTTANAGAQAAPAPGAPAQAPSGEVEALRKQLRDVEAKILQAAPAAAGQGGGDIEAAMKSRKVPVPLKAQRRKLQEQLRQAQAAPDGAAAAAPAARRLDHGELNIPGRTSTIDAELDRYKADQAKERKETARERSVVFKKRKAEARAALDEVGVEMVQSFKKLDPKAAKQELDSMATWEPEKLLALVERWKGEQGKAESAAPAPAPAATPASPARKPRGVLAKKAEADAKARADFFTPGNIVKSYGGHDRVVSYQAPDENGRWNVTVRHVQAQGGKWVDVPNQKDRVHATQPDAKELKAGPVARAAASSQQEATATRANDEADGAVAFRRDSDPAPFDTAGFLATMARSPFSQAARAQAVQSVQATVDAARAAWGPNAPQVVVAFDMQDPAVPEAARRADLRQRSGGARGAPEGFYYRGKAYLMASRLGTPNDAARVLFHEVLGHHGLRGKFGRELDQVLIQIATMRKKEVAAKMREYGLRGVDSLNVREAAEEVLAEMAEKTPRLHFVRRAVSAIRNWLRAHVPGFQSLRLTDNDIIQAYILPARGWVERGGAQAGEGAEPSFSRTGPASMPDAIIGGQLGTATSHPDYAAAKAGDIEAAVRVAQSLVTPELVAKVKAAIGDARPRVVPVVAEESTGRNKIPLTAAEVLARQLGLDVETGIVQANRAHRTGLDGLDRIFAPVDFAGTVAPGEYLLVDDTLTQGGTFAALADHIRSGGGEVAGVIALTGKQYSAKIQASSETLTSLRQKHGDLEDQFRAATGYGFDALTESEARYLARYEPAQRLRDRIVAAGRSSGERADQSDPGQDDGADGGLSFSRSKLSEITDSALDQLQQTMSHAGKVSLWDKTVGTMRHLGERAPAFKPVYEAAQRFIDDVSMLGNDAADRAPRLLPRVETLADLKKKPITAADNKAIARPLFEGTLLWGRDVDGKAVPVDDLTKKYGSLPAAEKAQFLLRAGRIEPNVLQMWQGLPLAQFEAAVNTRFEGQMLRPGVAWKAQELADLFGLTPQQVSLYQEARGAIDRSIDMTARADMLRAVGSEYAGMRELVLAQDSLEDAMKVLTDTLQADARENPDRAERLLGLNNAVVKSAERAQELQAAGYAPLSRFGRYTVDVVSPDGTREYFGMFETMREANQMRMRMASTFPGATVTSGTMSQEAFKLFQGITPESLEQFGGMLGLSSTGDEAKDKAFQAYLQLAKNNHSALKRLIHRKGISGYSEDVGRVLASFVYSNARLAAGGLNAGTLETAIEGIPKEQGELRDVAMGLRSYIQDPQEEGQAVRGMLFAQYLGGSVASALVNMTQPFQITMPWLSQYGGMRKAGAQLAAAVRDMARGGRGYEPDLVRALQAAEDDGVVSPQEIHQLMAQARGAGSLRTGDGTRAGDARAAAANNWERVKVAWGQPFALAEQFNRRSTFIAAYRLAKDQGMDAPAEFARRAVLETQFVYSKANKPKWARGAIGGTLFTFKTYSVSYLELMQRMWTQGGPEGRRAVGWALAMLMLMGGAGGLPFVEDLEDLIDGAGQIMGYNLSSKQWRKQAMRDAVGKELADFVENGVSGLPGAPIDISGRLGMGNLLPGTGLLLSKQSRERDLLEVVGPAGDLVARGFTGARKALTGDLGGAALEVSPAAVRNAVKGADMAASGIYKDQKGYKVIDTTLDEALAKAIGFQPRSVAEVQESNSAMQRAKSFYTQTSSEIKAQWADALFRKDEADLQRVRERLADWNRDNPDQPITVKMPDIWKRVREMGKDRTERIADTAPKALRQQMREMAREG